MQNFAKKHKNLQKIATEYTCYVTHQIKSIRGTLFIIIFIKISDLKKMKLNGIEWNCKQRV